MRVTEPIRAVLVDDHPALRHGTQAILQQAGGIEVIGATGEGAEALQLVESLRPDVLLLDLHLPDVNGVEVARRVRERCPEVAVLVLTGYEEVGYVRALRELGVRGFVGKTASNEQIVAAVRAVAAGRTVLVSEGVEATLRAGSPVLTSREQEVLRLLAAGKRNQEIADALCVSLKTVEFHVGHVLEKLGARSRTEAIVEARRQGFVD